MRKIAVLGFTFIVAIASYTFASEGKWTPQQVLQLDPQWLKSEGLELPPGALWNAANGSGLLSATVTIGPGGSGCSGGFISPDGLIITNHHCIFSILQEHSTPQNDIITNGFLARSRGDELVGKSVRVQIPRRFTDVTEAITRAVPKKADDEARQKAIEDKAKALVAECEKQPAARCKVASFDGGLFYTLIETMELPDVRVVWAPPREVGDFGGEIDNWMWPRHAGDFAIARAYVSPDGKPAAPSKDNVPYHPEFHFPISQTPLRPNDFVMVLGYPGVTYRSLTAAEMEERAALFFPRREEVYGEFIRTMEEAAKGNAEGEILVADRVKSLNNAYKNAQGQIAGFKRGRILEKQREADRAVLDWARSKKEYAAAVRAYDELASVVADQRKTWEHDFLLNQIANGARMPYAAWLLVHAAREKAKPDAARETDYQERVISKVRDRVEVEQKNYFRPADEQMFAKWLARAAKLPAASRIAAAQKILPDAVHELYEKTKVTDLAERKKMFDETEAQLRERHDPMLDFAFTLDDEMRALRVTENRRSGAIARLRPEWRRAVIAHAGHPVAPDANSTLRVSFAHVKGYEPRDAVFMQPQTKLSGVIEKHTGEEPFNVPAPILAAARAGKVGQWKDEKLGDVPVDFLADADTTGGNSGSPVVNGRGELVGVNFDRVWENVANDFGYNPDVARNVSADIRYLLWMLDQVNDADALLRELGVRR